MTKLCLETDQIMSETWMNACMDACMDVSLRKVVEVHKKSSTIANNRQTSQTVAESIGFPK